MTDHPGPPLFQPAFQNAGLAADALAARLEAALERRPYWFPVRHHSPACSYHLERTIKQRKPRIIFLEGPPEASDLIPHVTSPRTKPPIAIYSSFSALGTSTDGSPDGAINPARFSSWFPLLSFSPEYVAMTTARRLGAEVVFIDLPHFVLAAQEGTGNFARTVERESERLITESSFFSELTRAAGYRSWEEAWDTLFEVRPFSSSEDFRRELALFCAAARASASPGRVAADGSLQRERFMRSVIESTLRKSGVRPEETMAVSGGFHMFHDETDLLPPPPLPQGTLYTTIVPFSYPRVSTLSGYAAGNRAPQFYEKLWKSLEASAPMDVTRTHTVEVLRDARRRGELVSTADSISVAHTAVLLARLRRRENPVLDDINDALMTCCCKGNPAETGIHLQRAMAEVATGTRTGRVSPSVKRLPLLQDFYTQLENTGLGAFAKNDRPLELGLDLRAPADARTSAFLNRCRVLEIPAGKGARAAGNGVTLFRESWILRWNPGIEATLIERSAYGDSVETAAVSFLKEKILRSGHDSGAVCRLALDASTLAITGLPAELGPLCRAAIEKDGRGRSLCNALGSLLLLRPSLAARAEPHGFLVDLITRCFDRACLSIEDLVSVPPDQHEGVLEGVRTLVHAVLASGLPDLDQKLLTTQLEQASITTPHPFLRGAFLGFLCELRVIPPWFLAKELSSLAFSTTSEMVTAGDVLDGMVAASRASVLLGGSELIEAIDKLLRAAEWEVFVTMLPRLRSAMSRLDRRAADGFARKVAQKYGLRPLDEIRQLPRLLNMLATRLDQETSRIMQGWKLCPGT